MQDGQRTEYRTTTGKYCFMFTTHYHPVNMLIYCLWRVSQ